MTHEFLYAFNESRGVQRELLEFGIEVLQELGREFTVADLKTLEIISNKINQLEKLK